MVHACDSPLVLPSTSSSGFYHLFQKPLVSPPPLLGKGCELAAAMHGRCLRLSSSVTHAQQEHRVKVGQRTQHVGPLGSRARLAHRSGGPDLRLSTALQVPLEESTLPWWSQELKKLQLLQTDSQEVKGRQGPTCGHPGLLQTWHCIALWQRWWRWEQRWWWEPVHPALKGCRGLFWASSSHSPEARLGPPLTFAQLCVERKVLHF